MIIYPAIDLRNGHCVRLYQGDYQRETIYSADPFAVVKTFIADGARWLHIVDLDGAKDPTQTQYALITALMKAHAVNVQIGGGIRTLLQIKQLLAQGAERVIIGSMAVQHRAEVARWFQYFGAERLVLALDVRLEKNKQPMVATHAWQQQSEYSLDDLIEFYQVVGLKHLLCTNIILDGTLKGPDECLYDLLITKYPFLSLQASGGIRSLADINRLRSKRLSGAIIGRAFYEAKLTVREVLSC